MTFGNRTAATQARPGAFLFRRGMLYLTLLVLLVLGAMYTEPVSAAEASPPPQLGDYVLIGWNDLGMHCSNQRFADLAVLPPYNNVWATLIRRGSASSLPQVVGPGFSVSYSIEGNTYSVGKTDFWSWEDRLFGVQLPDNIGLHGKGLTGTLDWSTNHFAAEGIPLTPFTDADLIHEQPYQLGNLQAFDAQNNLLASTQIVVPVSNEMTCNACHVPQSGETVEHAILRRHDGEEGTHLVNQRPVLCANCHASNALGLPGNPNLPSLSLAMHSLHAEETDNCYLCHPGPTTQCLRDVMSQQYGLTCQSCHGHMRDVATSIENGRQPWRQEPRCETCHGASYAEMPNTLYRNSNNGHGGLFCETCHNSPHAILPSREERDNRQMVALQGHAGTLRQCTVCHGVYPSAPGPHGYYPTGVQEPGQTADLRARVRVMPNPARESTEINYRVADSSPIRLAVFDAAGREVRVLTDRSQTPGDHTLVWDGKGPDGQAAPSGVYFVRLRTGGESATARVVKVSR
jgi:hypothetical protein